ncbi:MAG: glycosyl hydrolase family 18 protein [Anaerolineae bacterium]
MVRSRRRSIFAAPRDRRALFLRIALFVAVPILVLVALWLPPFSLGNRLFHLDLPLVTAKDGGLVSLPDSASLKVAPDDVTGRARVKLSALDGQALSQLATSDPLRQAVAKIPNDLIARGSLYHLTMYGAALRSAELTLPIPADLPAVEAADLYGWDGSAWRWAPAQMTPGDQTLRATIAPVYTMYLIAQSQPHSPRIIAIGSAEELKNETRASLLIVTDAIIQEDGTLTKVSSTPADSSKMLLGVTNIVNGVTRSDWLDNLIANADNRQRHIQNILAAAAPYAGVELDYLGVSNELNPAMTAFVNDLATALHKTNKVLAIRLEIPVAASTGWQTGGYDWQALGAAVDMVNLVAPYDPVDLSPLGRFDQALQYITGEVDRRKINLTLSAYSNDLEGTTLKLITYKQALGNLVQGFATENQNSEALPGSAITVTIPALTDFAINLDPESQTYWFVYQDWNKSKHTVWLANASSISRKLQYFSRNALGGIALVGANNPSNDAQVAPLVSDFQARVVPPEPYFAFVWTVTDEQGNAVIEHISSLSEARLVWTAPNNPGNYIISGALSDSGGKSNLGPVATVAMKVPSLTPSPTASPTPSPTPEPTATATPEASPTPEVKPTPEETAEPEPEAPYVPPPSSSAGFGYGIQADFMSDGNHDRIFGAVQNLGLNWVKQQIEWFRYNPAPGVYDWGAIDRLVDGANARGINLLLSVVKAPGWARPAGDTDEGPPSDPATYAAFVSAMASRYRGRVQAYEIWNEQNLYYEWGGRGGKISASRYIELLRAAYNAIKAADPNAIVISGAPTPTGVTDYDIAVDDRLYLEQMYQAGLAYYCDAVGIHPSGYNNPPDAQYYDWSDPSAPGFKGHPSFFFRSNMEAYRNIMVRYGDGWKKLWVTEFGWSSVDGLGVGPAAGYDYANDNSAAEQAQFIVRAFQLGRAWGWVGPMFLWNLNFGPVSGVHDEKAAFGIVMPDWSPRPAYNALRDMGKW